MTDRPSIPPSERRAANLEAALRAARAGWPVFALAGGKSPYAGTHGFKDATLDEDTIRRVMARPGAVPGIALPAGVTVVDVDPRNGGSPEAVGLSADRADVRTGGGGWHFWFACDLQPRNNALPGVDLKGIGGYVVAPGAVLPDGKVYEGAIPETLPQMPDSTLARVGGRLRPAVQRADSDEIEQLGTRDDIIRWLGRLARTSRQTESEYLALLTAASDEGRIVSLDESRPWTEDDFRTLAREAAKWRVGDEASIEGWAPPVIVKIRRKEATRGELPKPDADLDDEAFRRKWGAVPLLEVDTTPPPPLVLGRLHPTEQTILFGMGGTGKGVVAAWWVSKLSHDERIMVVDFEGHADEWARRCSTFGANLENILVVEPYKNGLGVIWECAPVLDRLARDWGAARWVCDSIVAACGQGDALDARSPGLYAQAVQRISLPSLHLGHVVKTQGVNANFPFGSIFWHNWARITWSLEGSGDEPRVLTNRKSNTHSQPDPTEFDWSWVKGDMPKELRETSKGAFNPEELGWLEQIRSAGQVSVKELTVILGCSRNAKKLDEFVKKAEAGGYLRPCELERRGGGSGWEPTFRMHFGKPIPMDEPEGPSRQPEADD